MQIVLGCIIGYLILTNIIGLAVGRRVKSTPDFLVASSNFGWVFLVAILCGAWEGSGASIGITQQAYDKGIYPGFYTGFFTIGLVLAALFFVPILRKLKILTLPEFIGEMYGEAGRKITAVLWLAQDLIVLAMQFLGAAGIFSGLFGIPMHWGMLITLISVGAYMVMGGMVAAAWTNMLHTLVMLLSAVIAVPLAMNFGSGFQTVVDTLPQSYFHVQGMGMSTLMGWFLAVAAGPIIHQITFSTAASAKNDKEAKNSFFISASIIALYSVPFAILGVVAKTYLPEGTSLTALPMIAMEISPWFAGFLLSAVMAAILSTLAPMLFSAPTIFINDIYKPMKKNTTEKELLMVSRISSLVTLLIGLGLAMLVKSIVAATVFAFTFRLVLLLGVVIPLMFASLKFITVPGGLLGIALGAIAPTLSQFVFQSSIPGMYWSVLGMVVGIIVGSLFTRGKGRYIKTIWDYIKDRQMMEHKDNILG
ncbi:sodium:solute symporter family protein [Dehalobacterium formicoaceticum]|uniref:Sodium:solute symporter family protein n=1 Tax=Dehalobacterium formicoaceticum TaxID=51515 RepID=A0ABT1Y1B7_9FIRM|nr:sodium:solute symporter family protein [Dehalobacterium formicoaceticum]MCR6544653.1 sodium:solute symporter family protein [Dehalobacterium formicoaceticum]